MEDRKAILVSPLNWGLGHATRMTPIIHYLKNNGYRVVLAADGAAYHFLEEEFPELKLYYIPGIQINYGKHLPLALKMLGQLPGVFRGIARERKALSNILRQEAIGLIISDNRYGLYHPSVPSIFVTHQVNIQMPLFMAFVNPLVKAVNHRFINRFSCLLIPDVAQEPNLSGKLSHPANGIRKKAYIGPLSRLQRKDIPLRYDFIVLLSGPEPQRSMLEEKILSDPRLSDYKAAVVRGLPAEKDLPTVAEHVDIFNHVPAEKLSSLICASRFVISRPGYSTIMDLVTLNKQAVVIPTPGQTEQEYLAKHLSGSSYAILQQKDFSLMKAIVAGQNLTPPHTNIPAGINTTEIDKVLKAML